MSAGLRAQSKTIEVHGNSVTIVDAEAHESVSLPEGASSALMFVHGAGGLAEVPALKILNGRFRVVSVELPGIGQTPAGSARSMRGLGQVIGELISQLGLDGCTLVAESAMARAALWTAIEHAERIGRIVLLSPAFLLGAGMRVPTVPPALLVRTLQTNSAPASFTVGSGDEERFLKQAFGPAIDSELVDALPSIVMPALVVRGVGDYFDKSGQDGQLAGSMPQGHRVLVSDSGVVVAYERPASVATLIDDFATYGTGFLHDHRSSLIAG